MRVVLRRVAIVSRLVLLQQVVLHLRLGHEDEVLGARDHGVTDRPVLGLLVVPDDTRVRPVLGTVRRGRAVILGLVAVLALDRPLAVALPHVLDVLPAVLESDGDEINDCFIYLHDFYYFFIIFGKRLYSLYDFVTIEEII